MGKLKSKSSFDDGGSISSDKITAENYAERAAQFARVRGGEGFVIRTAEGQKGAILSGSPANEPQWHAWMVYLAHIGVKTIFARFHGLMTVPCEWPEDFDFAAPISDRHWQPPFKPRQQQSFNAPRVAPRRFPNDRREPTPLDHLAPVRPPVDYTVPLVVSDALRQSNAVRDIAILNAERDRLAEENRPVTS